MHADVLIVEKDFDGHRLYYVRLLVEHAQRNGLKVALMLSTGIEVHPEYVQQISRFENQIQVLHSDRFDVAAVQDFSRVVQASKVIVPDGDTFAISLAIHGGWRGHGTVTTLIMREAAESQSGLIWRTYLKRILKRLLILIAANSRRVRVVILKSPAWKGRSSLLTVTDPITISSTEQDITSMRKELNLAPDRYWFGVMGRVDGGKRPELIAQAIDALPSGNYGFAIVGKATDEMESTFSAIREFLGKKGIPTVIVSRRIDDPELDAALSLVDCNIIIRSNGGPSGILGKTLALGQRSVVTGTRSLRSYSEVFPDNVIWAPLTYQDLANAMQICMERKDKAPRHPTHFEDFASILVDT